jgi:major membrane immunogen (membrane-anchored lipoprotein)
MKKFTTVTMALLLLLTLVLVCGCKVTMGYVGSNSGNQINGSFHLFNGTKTNTIEVHQGKVTFIHYDSEVKQGELTMKIFNSEKELLLDLKTNTAGTESIIAVADEKYELVITGVDTEGSFSVDWEEK